MHVVVAAYGDLRRHLLGGAAERHVDVPAGATLTDVVEALGGGPDEVVLGRRGSDVLRENSPLADGDVIELFAPIGGG